MENELRIQQKPGESLDELFMRHHTEWEDVDKQKVADVLATVTPEEQEIMLKLMQCPPQEVIDKAGGVPQLWLISLPSPARLTPGLERIHQLTQNWRVAPLTPAAEQEFNWS